MGRPEPARDVRASLIVLNYEGIHVLGDCVDSLLAAIGPEDEIIVVDSASTDGSPDVIAETSQVAVVRLPENRYIFGLNAGLARARGEYVAFLNNDMVVEAGFVEALVEGFEGSEVFAVCARILDRHGHEQGSRTAGFWAHGVLHYESLPHSKTPTDCFFAVGGQSLFRRAQLQELGSIDPLLWPMYHEDIELSFRAWKRGWRIRYAPDAVVHHLGSHSSKRVFTPSQLRSFVRQNEFLTVWKDITDPPMLAEHGLWLIPRFVKAAIVRDWPTFIGFWSAARRAPRVLRARRLARGHVRISDREVLRRVGRAAVDVGSTAI